MTNKIKVLFLCTGNSCRSQMAESILRHLGGTSFEALSAGSHPAGFVHALAAEAMRMMNIPMVDAVSKSWDEFAAKRMDVVITVCDSAAGQTCPMWPGDPVRAHWSLPDPVYHSGEEEERVAFALQVAKRLYAKIEGLVGVDWSAPRSEIEDRLAFLGQI